MNVTDVTKLVEEIHQILLETDPVESELMDLASRHEEVVELATLRLKEIETLLDKGLRPEAIDLAEKAPNLNDIVTALDFAEFEIWNDTLVQFGIQPIQQLPVDIASELNDAYSIAGPLDSLLKRYRTQSLARAPMAERIATLRELRREDKANIRWHLDVEKFETHRLSQMRKELQTAIKKADLNVVAAIDNELASAAWTVKIPGSLRRTTREAHRKLRVDNALGELKPLAHELSDAYAEFDQARATPLRNRFQALADIANLPPTHELFDIASPAMDWLKEEEDRTLAEADYEQGKNAIEAALEGPATVEELERLYHQTIRHGHTLPELLENRIAERTQSLQKQSSRRQTTLLTFIVSACAVACIGIVFIVKTVNFQKTVDGHVAQITELLRNARATGDLQAVDDYFDNIETEDTRFAEQPKLLGLREQLEGIRKEEESRHQQLDALIADSLKLGVEQQRWEDFPRAEALLVQADGMARNGAERTRLVNARSQIQDAKTSLQVQVDGAFEEAMGEVVDLIAQLPKDSVDAYAAVETRISELEKRGHVSSGLKTTLASLQAKVRQEKSMVAANLEIARKLQKITESVSSPLGYRQALVDYTKVEPGTTRTSELQEVIQSDLPLWESVDKWNSISDRVRSASLTKTTPAEATTLIVDIEAFQAMPEAYPGETQLKDRLEALQAIAVRSGSSSGSSAEQVSNLFAPRTISQAFVIRTTDETYFAASQPVLSGSSIKFKYFTTTTGTLTEDKTFGLTRVPAAVDLTPEQWVAPQTKMAKKLRPRLVALVKDDFEESIAFGVESLVGENTVDPILRFLLIDKLLKIGAEGSIATRRAAAIHLNQMSTVGVSRLTNWVEAKNDRAIEERQRASDFMKEFGDQIIADLRAAVDNIKDMESQPVGAKMVCVGWLHRNATADWVISLKDELRITQPTELFALGRLDAPEASFYPVATIQHNAIGTVPANQVSAGKEGHRVYRRLEVTASATESGRP